MAFLDKVVKFIGHYSDELSGISDALSLVINALPINRGDKQNIQNIIDRLDNGVQNIDDAMKGLIKESKVIIKQSDIEAALKKVLPPLIAAEIKKANEADKKAKGTSDAKA